MKSDVFWKGIKCAYRQDVQEKPELGVITLEPAHKSIGPIDVAIRFGEVKWE